MLTASEVRMIRAQQHDIDPIYGVCLKCGDTDARAWVRGYFLPCLDRSKTPPAPRETGEKPS